jgi:hypothetical protein
MAKPVSISLTKKEQSLVLSSFKKGMSAYAIADMHNMPRRQVMSLLESKGKCSYSEGSYN